jgi:hypothetical protein
MSLHKTMIDLQSYNDSHDGDEDVVTAGHNEDVGRRGKMSPPREASATVNHKTLAGAEASRRGGLGPGIHPIQAGSSRNTPAAGVDRLSAYQISAPAVACVIDLLAGIFLL